MRLVRYLLDLEVMRRYADPALNEARGIKIERAATRCSRICVLRDLATEGRINRRRILRIRTDRVREMYRLALAVNALLASSNYLSTE